MLRDQCNKERCCRQHQVLCMRRRKEKHLCMSRTVHTERWSNRLHLSGVRTLWLQLESLSFAALAAESAPNRPAVPSEAGSATALQQVCNQSNIDTPKACQSNQGMTAPSVMKSQGAVSVQGGRTDCAGLESGLLPENVHRAIRPQLGSPSSIALVTESGPNCRAV